MSEYSTDSLEDAKEISSRNQNSLHGRCKNGSNLKSTKICNVDLSTDLSLTQKRGKGKTYIGSNETTPNTHKDTGTASGRNAIIANRGLVDASKRQRPASSRNGKRDVADRFKRNNTDKSRREDGVNQGVSARCTKRFSKTFTTKRSCCPRDIPMAMKTDKKLGNVLAPKVQQARKPCSYLELYRRRFSGPQYKVRSPEGSTLSVCGDSEREELSDDDTRSLATPRDDQSELSFYRRIIEGSTDPAALANRSTKTVRGSAFQDTNSIFCSSKMAKHNTSDDKSKSLGYRPYTIEEYKTLSIPKLDRSLGPDKVEMQAKREWLMRRRSYGNSVSARNRQRILLQAHRIKTKDTTAEKCFLPLKDQQIDAKIQDDSISSTIFEDQEVAQKRIDIDGDRYSKKNRDVCKKPSSRRSSKKFERTSSFCSSLNSYDIIEDSYLESLRQRHLYEKEMVDRIINQTLCS
ncbi:uncharacterized protein LOC132911525 isoform X1 [Bombus pascuorum]|uniref:uncharacterized protein LOC132911525 isoform X1 n=1 Tax=Bombus pascuorum TaxID=65598 RepID=UPI0021358568|nr:uncharacterized protein LOC132911525 isoform X1 [Bombus pascuorum]